MNTSTRMDWLLQMMFKSEKEVPPNLRIQKKHIVTPSLEMPKKSTILGYSPMPLQVMFTRYIHVENELTGSDEYELCKLAEEKFEEERARGLPDEELVDFYDAVRQAQARVSTLAMRMDTAWSVFLAHAANLFPHHAYVDKAVVVYSNWALAIPPPTGHKRIERNPRRPGYLKSWEPDRPWLRN